MQSPKTRSKGTVGGDDRRLKLVEHSSLFWLCLEVMHAEVVPSEHSESQVREESCLIGFLWDFE